MVDQIQPTLIKNVRKKEPEKILNEGVSEKVLPILRKIVTTKEGIGAIGGGAIGAALGGSLGVAGKIVGIGVALNGGIVLAGVGALVGFLGVKAFKKSKDEKSEEEKIKAYGEKINQETRDKNK